jgi:hypothetical protein
VTIGNGTAEDEDVDLTGWILRDRAGNRFALTGIVAAQQHLTIMMREFSMPLNNSGDDVSLLDLHRQIRHHVSYTATQAQAGNVVAFEGP